MNYLLVKHRVADFEKWGQVFDSHLVGQRESGLELLHLLREIEDPNMVVLFFHVHDLEKAQAFTSTPEASKAAEESGVEGEAEAFWLTDQVHQ